MATNILTDKQKKAIKNRVSGMNMYQSAKAAGYSESVAKKAGHIIFDQPFVKKKLAIEMRKAGIDEILIGKLLRDGLNATGLYGKNSKEHTDYKTRLDYIKYINEVNGIDIKKNIDVTSDGKAIKIGLFTGGLPDAPDQPETE